MIYKEVTLYDMLNDDTLNTRFTYYAIKQIYEYFDECFETWEYDPVAIYCDFMEQDEKEIRNEYLIDDDVDLMEYLTNYTLAYELENGFILYIRF